MSQKLSRWVALMSTAAAKRRAGARYGSSAEDDEVAMLKMLPPAKTTEELEHEMFGLKQVQEYMALVREGNWRQTDPHDFLPPTVKHHHMTAGSLRGERMLNVTPLKFMSNDNKSIVLFLHLGRSLCGHDNVIHGGMLASILDEATWMAAIPSMPGNAGYTANLNVNFRKRVGADQFVMVNGEFEKVEGRKGWSKATIHDLDGTVLADGTALFVSPFKPTATAATTHAP
ncbi:hypothetical protein BGZ94_007993 [Podila epigama]|nr:hypothetical protein BGZ94_007993 [Podila epigama]